MGAGRLVLAKVRRPFGAAAERTALGVAGVVRGSFRPQFGRRVNKPPMRVDHSFESPKFSLIACFGARSGLQVRSFLAFCIW